MSRGWAEEEVGRNGLKSGLQQPEEGGSEGTPATAEGSGHAWTADAQREPSVSRWRWLRHGADHPAAEPWDTLTGGPGSQPRLALLLRSNLRDRKEGQRLVLVGFIFFQCSVTFLANLRFEICLLARF